MGTEKTLQALGLCAKARKLISGTPMICDALKAGKPKLYLILAASDNSENTAKRLCDRCAYYSARLVTPGFDGDELARALGKQSRVAAVAVTDENLFLLVENTLKKN